MTQPLLNVCEPHSRKAMPLGTAESGHPTRCACGNSRDRPRASRSKMRASSLLSSSRSPKAFLPVVKFGGTYVSSRTRLRALLLSSTPHLGLSLSRRNSERELRCLLYRLLVLGDARISDGLRDFHCSL